MTDGEPQFAYTGPGIMPCIEAAMRADPSLTLEQAIVSVPISWETLALPPAVDACAW